MMKKSPLMHWLGMFVWIVTALVSICVGLRALGFDILQTEFMIRYYAWEMPLRYIIGASGLMSFILLIMHVMHGCRCDAGCTCGTYDR